MQLNDPTNPLLCKYLSLALITRDALWSLTGNDPSCRLESHKYDSVIPVSARPPQRLVILK